VDCTVIHWRLGPIDLNLRTIAPIAERDIAMAKAQPIASKLPVFISYSRRDHATADALVEALGGRGFAVQSRNWVARPFGSFFKHASAF
jgi:hypothetical protein